VDDTRLIEVLGRSRGLGFLGPGSVRVHVDHAAGFATGVAGAPAQFLDLGSGGGVPGLVLAQWWPGSRAVLLDARERRCGFLREAVRELELDGRVVVVWARAEEAGHRDYMRGAFDLVVARGFGSPAVTAECGAPFLCVGGMLAVSEPPDDDDTGDPGDPSGRWPAGALARLGLAVGTSWTNGFRYQALDQFEPCPERYARNPGVPAKRPLF
jgi:16S rRNA (guanine527-N7)-methyltransferase